MRYYISIDGGGTKTEGIIVNAEGEVLQRVVLGSSNPNDIGIESAIHCIKNIVEMLIPTDAKSVFVAVGGSGMKSSGIKERLECELLRLTAVEEAQVFSDIDFAYSSAIDGDGCILIIGTGCVGYMKKKNQPYIIGGGGYLIDDLLSGFDLGKAVLNAVLSEYDGRGEKTLLSEMVLKKTRKDIWSTIREVYIKGKSFVAEFSPFVFEGIEQGDAVSIGILQKSVKNLESLLVAMYNQNNEPLLNVTIFGGLTKCFDVISTYFSAEIKQKIAFLKPKDSIIFGGITCFIQVDEAFKKKFKESYQEKLI